jgi:hypothetical protein
MEALEPPELAPLAQQDYKAMLVPLEAQALQEPLEVEQQEQLDPMGLPVLVE